MGAQKMGTQISLIVLIRLLGGKYMSCILKEVEEFSSRESKAGAGVQTSYAQEIGRSWI